MRGRIALLGLLALCTALAPMSPAIAAAPQPAAAWDVRQHPAPSDGKIRSSDPADVSCGSATNCVSVGTYDSIDPSLPHRLFLATTDPTTGITQAVAAPLPADVDSAGPGELTGVGCGGARCVAVGSYFTAAGVEHPLLETQLRADRWSVRTVRSIKGGLGGIACSIQSCVATGVDESGPLLVVPSGTGWMRANITLPAAETLSEVHSTCPLSGTCVAYGTARASNGSRPVLLYPSGSGWTGVNFPVPSGINPSAVHLGGMSCTSTANCVAFASFHPSPFNGDLNLLAEILDDGVLRAKVVRLPRVARENPGIRVIKISCGTAVDPRCEALTYYGADDPEQGQHGPVFFGVVDGVVTASPDPGFPRNVLDLSCFEASSHTRCVAVGGGPTAATYRAGHWSVDDLGRPRGIPRDPPDWQASLDSVSCAAGSCLSIGDWVTLDQGMFPHDEGALLGRVSGIA